MKTRTTTETDTTTKVDIGRSNTVRTTFKFYTVDAGIVFMPAGESGQLLADQFANVTVQLIGAYL